MMTRIGGLAPSKRWTCSCFMLLVNQAISIEWQYNSQVPRKSDVNKRNKSSFVALKVNQYIRCRQGQEKVGELIALFTFFIVLANWLMVHDNNVISLASIYSLLYTYSLPYILFATTEATSVPGGMTSVVTVIPPSARVVVVSFTIVPSGLTCC